MKKFILACACAFALGVSVSAQTPQKKEPAKTCCSPGAKSCDCKAGSACEKDGKKTCKNAQSKEAAKCDKKDGAKCDKKDGAKKSCCKDSSAPSATTVYGDSWAGKRARDTYVRGGMR